MKNRTIPHKIALYQGISRKNSTKCTGDMFRSSSQVCESMETAHLTLIWLIPKKIKFRYGCMLR